MGQGGGGLPRADDAVSAAGAFWTALALQVGITRFSPFPDQFKLTLKGMYAQKGWSRESVYRFVTEVYRACRPDVVVTQDVNGEYGHGAHRGGGRGAGGCRASQRTRAIRKDGAQASRGRSRLYIHLYEQNPVKMDWRKPLAAFEGRDGVRRGLPRVCVPCLPAEDGLPCGGFRPV